MKNFDVDEYFEDAKVILALHKNNMRPVLSEEHITSLLDDGKCGLAAPGTNILSLDLNGGYSPMNGTSLASPHVAGAAALLKAYLPGITTPQLKTTFYPVPCGCSSNVLTGGLLNVKAMFERVN